MAGSNRWDQLISEWEPRLQRAFLDSIYALRNQAQIDQIVRMLENGDVNGALQAVGLDPLTFRPFDRSLTQAFDSGGEVTAALVPVAIDTSGFRTVFQFAIRNPDAELWLKTYSAQLVTGILDDQRTAIRNFLSAGLEQGANPRTTALDLIGRIVQGRREGGVLGLTSTQEEWARTYAADLASDDPAQALTRVLRDKRFDRAVMKAADSGRPLEQSLIDKMVTSYRNRALRYRGETIARKETITALHTAQDMAMRQAIAKGVVSANDVTFVWHTAHDNRVRDSHRPMDGQVRKQGQTFETGDGNQLRYPGDPAGPASETINCRCYREPKINFMSGIK